MHHISQEEYDDFMNEPDTEPFIRTVQRQLNSSESVVAAGEILGYSADPPKHWTEKLEMELDGAVVEVDAVSFLVDTL